MSISIYVRTDKYRPSNYYRIVQYAKYLKGSKVNTLLPSKLYILNSNSKRPLFVKLSLGLLIYIWIVISLTIYLIKDNLNPPKYIVVQRELVPKYLPIHIEFLLRTLLRKTNLIWDFDDDVFEKKQASEKELDILCEYSKYIVTTSSHLSSKLKKKYQKKTILMPTTDMDMVVSDMNSLNSKRLSSYKEEIRLIWVATSSNLPNLEMIIDTLDKTALKIKEGLNKDLILTVVCNLPLEVRTKYLLIRNVKWSREIAIKEVHKSHIGIMPLVNNEYNKGKGAFKLVQFISAGLPVIGSNIGFNSEVINNRNGILVDDLNEWSDAIMMLSKSQKVWEIYSKNAIVSWKEKFDFQKNLNKWKSLLENE